jgi:hypothetical protein
MELAAPGAEDPFPFLERASNFAAAGIKSGAAARKGRHDLP